MIVDSSGWPGAVLPFNVMDTLFPGQYRWMLESMHVPPEGRFTAMFSGIGAHGSLDFGAENYMPLV